MSCYSSLVIAALGVLSLNSTLAFGLEEKQTASQKHSNISAELSYGQIFKENIQSAVANHPRTSAAIALKDSHKFRQNEASSGLYPTLDFGVSGRYRFAKKFENRFDNITERSRRDRSAYASLTGRHLLYDAGKTRNHIESAKHSFTAAYSEYEKTASTTALLAVESHFQVMFQRERTKLQQEVIKDHRATLNKVKIRFESGRGAERDVTLLDSRLALALADAAMVRKDLETMTSRYEENYGFAPANLKSPAITLDLPLNLGEALEQGFHYNTALKISSSMKQASKSAMRAERADYLPHVTMEVAATKYDLDRNNSDYDISVRLLVNYNIYSGGATSARISRARKDYERSRYDEENILREVEREIKVAFQNIQSHDVRLSALKKATSASQKNSQQLLEQFEATGGSLLSLLEARKDFYHAREQYLAAKIEQEILRYRLLDTIGTLNMALNIELQKNEG